MYKNEFLYRCRGFCNFIIIIIIIIVVVVVGGGGVIVVAVVVIIVVAKVFILSLTPIKSQTR